MAYSDFNLRKLENKFGITYRKVNLFTKPLRKIQPSNRLVEDLEEAKHFPILTEKAKSELLIMPILKELNRINPNRFTVFSGFQFDIDIQNELNGICDFLFSDKADAIEITDPVFCMVEAKNRTIEEGFGQCGAEMYAARLYNQTSSEIETIYGSVTNGTEWIFLKLEGNELLIDNERYALIEADELLGAFQNIIDFYP
jgi:hypothetical protein